MLPGRRADLAGQLPTESFATDSLRIADLGYFSLVEMAKLEQEGNFWWSRLRNDTLLATLDGNSLSLEETGCYGHQSQPSALRAGGVTR